MKTRNFIHALVIVALCYSQLVTGVHFAGHFHVHECESTISTAVETCSKVHHDFRLIDSAVHLDHQAHNSPPEDSNHTENDCAIYHAYLSLSGVLCATTPGFYVAPKSPEKNAYALLQLFEVSRDNQRIRAPPSLS